MTQSKVTYPKNMHILEEYGQDIHVAGHGPSTILSIWFYTTKEREAEHNQWSYNSCYLLRKPDKNPV